MNLYRFSKLVVFIMNTNKLWKMIFNYHKYLPSMAHIRGVMGVIKLQEFL